MLWRNPSLLLFWAKKKTDTVNKIESSQASNKTLDTSKSNKTDTIILLDKSRYTKRTDTENTVDKFRYIPGSNYSNESTRIGKTSEIHIHKENLSVSIFSGKGESVSSVTLDNLFITCNNKGKKNPDTLIIRKQPIQEPVNTRKMAKENNLTDVEKRVLNKHLQRFVIK